MSLTYTCDLCGAMIDREAAYVTLNGNGDRAQDFWRTGYVGHYHADPEIGCWNLILDTIRQAAPSHLDTIPTASYQAITAKRRKHRPLEPDDGIAPPA